MICRLSSLFLLLLHPPLSPYLSLPLLSVDEDAALQLALAGRPVSGAGSVESFGNSSMSCFLELMDGPAWPAAASRGCPVAGHVQPAGAGPLARADGGAGGLIADLGVGMAAGGRRRLLPSCPSGGGRGTGPRGPGPTFPPIARLPTHRAGKARWRRSRSCFRQCPSHPVRVPVSGSVRVILSESRPSLALPLLCRRLSSSPR